MRPDTRSFAALRSAREGLAAVEFALVALVLVVLMIGLYDLTSAYVLWRRLTQAAQSIGEITTKIAVQLDGTNKLTYQQGQVASAAVYPIVPGIQAGVFSPYGVTMSVVTFSPAGGGTCTDATNCVAKIQWSAPMLGTTPPRPCGTLTAAANGASSTPTTLPTDAFQPSSILVVDVAATYQPLFVAFITGPLSLTRSSYLPPRSGAITDWIQMAGGAVTICP